MRFSCHCEAFFDTDIMVFVSSDLKVVDPPNWAKRQAVSQNGANWGPCRGSPALGVRLADPLAFCQWGSAIGRPPMAESPGGGIPGCRFASSILCFAPFFWFLGFFLK